MATIATLNTVFVATVDKFQAGVRGARGTLASFEKAVFSVQGALAGLGVALSAGAIGHEISEAAEGIDRIAKTSDRLGIATETLVGMQHAAKLANIETEALDQALTKMANTIATAAQGGKSEESALERLGLTGGKLAQMPLDKALLKVADGLKALDSPAARTAAAIDIFGKSGAQLLPLLQDGSKGIEEMAAEADKLGISFSRIDAAQVEAANDALTRVGEVVKGIWMQMAIQLAPIIETIAKKFTDWASSGTTASKIITNGLEMVAKGIGVVADVVDVVHDAFEALQAGVTVAIAVIIDGLAMFAKGLDFILNKIPGVNSKMGEFLQNVADEIHKSAAKQWEDAKADFAKPPPSQGIEKFFADIRSNAEAAAEKVAETSKVMAEIKPDFGNVTKFFAGLQSIALKASDKVHETIFKQSADVVKDLESPLDKFNQKMNDLQALKGAGGINDEQFAMAKNKELAALAATLPERKNTATAAEFGTAAAFSAQIRNESPQLRTEKEILEEAKKQTEFQKQLVDNAAKNGLVVVQF